MKSVYGDANNSSGRASVDKELDLIICIIEIWGLVACLASDWFKRTFVELGALEFTLDILYTLKVMVDSLDRMKIYEQWKLKRQEPVASAAYFEGE